MYEDKLREELKRLLGEYVPTEADMNNLSSYLYKVVVSVFKDADMKKEYKSIKGVTQLDEDGFKKAVKDISLFITQRLVVETFNKTYRELKNVVPSVKVEDVKVPKLRSTKPTVTSSGVSGEAEFTIDVASVPKVKRERKAKVTEAPIEKRIASEFEPDVEMDLDSINKSSVGAGKPKKLNEDEDLTLGVGMVSGETFSDVPEINFGLDY